MIKKIKMLLSKGMAFIYVWIIYKLKKKSPVDNKDILVIFGGHIGNAILHACFLDELSRMYADSKDTKLHLMINYRNLNVLKKILDLSRFEILDIDFPFVDGGTSFGNVFKTVRYFRNYSYDKILVNIAHIMPLAGYIVATTNVNASIGVFDDIGHKADGSLSNIDHNFGGARWYFERAFTDPIKVDYNCNEVVRLKYILQKIGNKEFTTQIVHIPKLTEFKPTENKYITIALDSSTEKRRLEMSKFSEVSNHIIEKYGLYICTTGGKGSERLEDEYLSKIEYPDHVLRYVGNTSFDEWVELIRGAEFHIGVDSGSIHIASAVGTQAFCIVGAWDGKRTLPYCIAKETKDTVSPVCIYMEGIEQLPCYGCLPRSGTMGCGNTECAANCSSGKPCQCLEKINSETIINTIDEWFKFFNNGVSKTL